MKSIKQFIHQITGGGLTALLALAAFANKSLAGVPEPDNIVYGSIVINEVLITHADTDVVVEARRASNGDLLASFRMGDDDNPFNYYTLNLQRESGSPVSNPRASITGDQLVIRLLDAGGLVAEKPFVIGSIGEVTQLNFGSQDLDMDGILDDWEDQYFSGNADPNLDSDMDGRNNLLEFLQGTNPLIADTSHPADNNPTNNFITITEVSAYSLAWKTGATWPTDPNPIPIDYVTRAGVLWKGGEYYKVDTAVSPTAPLWWVNTTPPAMMNQPSEGEENPTPLSSQIAKQSAPAPGAEPTVVRSMPIAFEAGTPLPVNISVTPVAGTVVYAIQESAPAGWTVGQMTEGGSYDANNHMIKWGPFFDDQPRVLAYSATPDAGSDDAITLGGVGSFDGSNAAILGHQTVLRTGSAPTALSLPTATSEGFEFHLTTASNSRFAIDVSEDLATWTQLTSVTPDESGRLLFTDPGATQMSRRFYRARPTSGSVSNSSLR